MTVSPKQPAQRRCVECRRRWPQHKSGRCRACERTAGDALTQFERDAERLARQQAKAAACTRAELRDQAGARAIVIEGREFDVIWNGTW